ncbi:MAG: A/G-specific adenine glycosylase [Deltaproteobacteria bacterium]|nr:MAG: A/G-specific adenine glycosylase [Deltaproteobacteria bacterium]
MNSTLADRLVSWFAGAKRDLPWRKEPRDPYRVWISEVMLQQTRVDVVIPYYRRFLRRFPTLRALAEAPLDDVLAHWSRAAQACGGSLPGTAAQLRTLPGFGPYTAAAVASLAFGEDVPLVDGNVARVLSRIFTVRGDARAKAWKIAAQLLPAGGGGPFNEALMELGATVCTPRNPACGRCPVQEMCRGRNDPTRYPSPRRRAQRLMLEWRALALRRRDGAVLLARRPTGTLFAGLWDLPAEKPTLTHREVSVMIGTARASGTPVDADVRWMAPEGIAALGISSLARKSLRCAGVLTPARTSRTLPAP